MIKKFISTVITNTLFLTVVLLPTTFALAAEPTNDQPAPAEAKSQKHAGGEITLAEFGSLAERWLKMKVLAGDKANNTIHINLSKEPLSYGQFLTQLNINGYTAYKSNDYILIVPNREARNLSVPIADKHKTYADDEYVTDFLKSEKSCSEKILPAIRPLVPQYAFLTVYPEANMMLIVDTYSNIQRVKSVIKTLEANLDEKEDCGRIKNIFPQPEKK